METKYILPATVAASLHLLALFGFNSPHVPVPHLRSEPVSPPQRIPVTFNEPLEPPDEPDRAATKPKGETEALRPSLDEPPATIADVTMPLPPASPQPVDLTPTIVPGVPGVPNGRDGPISW